MVVAASASSLPVVPIDGSAPADVKEEEEEEEEDADGDEEAFDVDSAVDSPAFLAGANADLPELGFYDSRPMPVSVPTLVYEGYASAPLVPAATTADLGIGSLGMQRDMSAQTMSSMLTMDDDGSELASPPFEATLLPQPGMSIEGAENEKEVLAIPQLQGGMYSHSPLQGIASA